MDAWTHAAIDGTGRVREPVDPVPLAAVGQTFRMDLSFPPFGPEHLPNFLRHLAGLAA